jgi:two-component system, OmpR family, alkaline phosphatase synthesis response regulator PhoP
MHTPPRILVVEDEPDIQELITYNLKQEGFETAVVGRGELNPDLILLDLMLPGTNGIEVCKVLKSSPAAQAIPIIMLTAKGTETDKVVGLEIGADDYVTKPFSPAELVARVRAVLRRSAPAPSKPSEFLKVGELVMNLASHQVLLGADTLALTLTEYNILKELLSEAGRVLNRSELMNRAIGHGVSVTDRTIDVHMAALRKKLSDYGDRIETVRGVGYRFKN